MDSLVQTPRIIDEAAGNLLRTYLQKIEELAKEVQFTNVGESAGFIRRVSVGMHTKLFTICMMVLGGRTGAFREKTLPRVDPESEIIARILGHQNWSSSSSKRQAILTSTESKSTSPPHQETVQNPALFFFFSEAQTAAWSGCNTMIQITLQQVVNKRIIKVRKNLVRHSRQPNFILSGERKWTDILA